MFIKRMLPRFIKSGIKKAYQRVRPVTTEPTSVEPVQIDDAVYSKQIPSEGLEYHERKAVGFQNLSEKIKRQKEGGNFEWPHMIALNQAIARFIGRSKRIVDIGAGTGIFEYFVSVDKSLGLIASEFDEECVAWCKENRQRDNIIYGSLSMKELKEKYGLFDLAITVDVIEHVEDFRSFLADFSGLSNRAIITTPNRERNLASALAGRPGYYQHVREWDAGELLWVLRNYYERVDLYSMPNPYVPTVQKIGLMSTMTPLIAVCEGSFFREGNNQ
ncbi:methyltransferase domain-containing protein [bacterium]|nr:methyltransferase domain-containing protein [bacterium]